MFNGTLEEFEERVKKVYENNKYGKDYLAIIEFIKIKFNK
jgi:hypothetical protein